MSVERPDNPRCIIPEEQVRARVQELSKEIEEDYRGSDLVAVCVLNGSFVFFADLIRNIDLPMRCEFMGLANYGDNHTDSAEMKITLDLAGTIAGKDVLLVEDLVASGKTINFLRNALIARNPNSIKVCSLIHRSSTIEYNTDVNYIGFEVKDEFVVGYGIGSHGRYRGLSYIGALERPL